MCSLSPYTATSVLFSTFLELLLVMATSCGDINSRTSGRLALVSERAFVGAQGNRYHLASRNRGGPHFEAGHATISSVGV